MSPDQAADTPVPTEAAAAVQQIVSDPARLGLVWNLRPATVTDVVTNVSHEQVQQELAIQMDGDDVPITAVNISGSAVSIGTRVYAIEVPPGGVFVIGTANISTAGRGILKHVTSTGATNFTTETVILTLSGVTFPAGRAFQLTAKVSYTVTVAGFGLFLFRRTNIAGFALAEFEYVTAAGGAANECLGVAQFVNTGAAAISQDVVLTAISSAGTGTAINTQPFGPFFFQATDIGPASLFPGLPSI